MGCYSNNKIQQNAEVLLYLLKIMNEKYFVVLKKINQN